MVTSKSVDTAPITGSPPYEVRPVVVSWGLQNLPNIVAIVLRLRAEVVLLQYPTSTYRRQIGIFLLPLFLRLLSRSGAQCILMIVHEFRRTPLIKRVAIAFMIATAHRTLIFPEDLESLKRFLPARLLRISKRPPSPPSFPDSFVSASDRATLRHELGCADGEALAVHFGFISPRKGLHTLVGALGYLMSTTDVRLHLMVVGDPAPGMAPWVTDLRMTAASLGLQSHITWCGYQEDRQVLRILKAADMCVLPFDDGFSPGSASFAQAAACGVPIITTRPASGSASEKRVVDGTHVLLFPPRDSRALGDAIHRLITDLDVGNRLRANVRQLSANQADTTQAILDAIALVRGPRTKASDQA